MRLLDYFCTFNQMEPQLKPYQQDFISLVTEFIHNIAIVLNNVC